MNTNTKKGWQAEAYKDDNGKISSADFFLVVSTLDEAKKIAATFPKWMGVKATTLTSEENVFGYVTMQALLFSTNANKGVNETGMKRLVKMSSMVKYEVVRNCLNSITSEEFAKLVK